MIRNLPVVMILLFVVSRCSASQTLELAVSGSQSKTTQDEYKVIITSNRESNDVILRVLFEKPKDNIPIINADMYFYDPVFSLRVCATTPNQIIDTKNISLANECKQLLKAMEEHKENAYFLLSTIHGSSKQTNWWMFDPKEIDFQKIRKNIKIPNEKNSFFGPIILGSVGLASIILLFCIFKYYR